MKCRVSVSPDVEKPPRQNPGGQTDVTCWTSALERVTALPVFDFGGGNGQAHLLAQDTGDKPSDRVSLPAGSFHKIFSGGATGPLQQVEELDGLAASDSAGFPRRLGRLRAFVGLLGRGPTLAWTTRRAAVVRRRAAF
jgi:hypothetical protein